MAAFSYQALDPQGSESSGTLEADNARHARTVLRERGLYPTSITPLGENQKGQQRLRVSTAELCLLTRQLSALLSAKLTVEQALLAVSEQTDKPAARSLLAAVRSEVMSGYSLRAALDRFDDAFPVIYRASVSAGEKSGQLPYVMEMLATYLEQQDALRRKMLQALLYPAIVTCVAMMVIIGLMTYVVPRVAEVFVQSHQTLPLLTRLLIGASDFLRNWGLWLLLLIVAAVFAFRHALRDDAVRRRWHRWLLGLPMLGRHLRSLDTARFASTLAILVSAGVPLLAGLDAGRQVMKCLPLKDAVALAADRVREGSSLSAAMRQARTFPPLLIHMLASGEATGDLSTMLARCASLQQAEVENRSLTLTTLLEPLLLLGMGGSVLLIVLAVMQPIIELNSLVK
ncbi:type II secretion system inner membrane protein GspF [Uliginosibacterium sp. H3]|uniref:General secretion pathway protein F n=1 Tax=Uliginosibacterium silvisoli TaxID=3114758 RepID=A0ABU6KB17_9RHOO|nr:type II secretion system inner membrane protein GspF [Uliginosibacterium sp. H3]